jgi:exosome complex component RRP4
MSPTSFPETMISFTSFPKPKDSFSYAPPKFLAEDEDMDIDAYEDDDDGEDFDSGTKLTCPGEPITSSHAYMRCVLFCMVEYWNRIEVQSKCSGHGTFVDQEAVISSVAGTIERVNKLVTVRAVRTRYNPEVGDLVVGRITEVWGIADL